MKIKKGDKVKILAGSDKGKIGKVLRVLPEEGRVTVEGVNARVRHTRPRREREKGQKIEFNAPLAMAKVMLICPKCDKPGRVGKARLPEGKIVRRCPKCKEFIDRS